MEPKKIILCPNPDRDTGMKATKSAIAILRDMGFQTVVCSPFRDPKTGDGSADKPYATLVKAVTEAEDGSTIYVMSDLTMTAPPVSDLLQSRKKSSF